MTGITPGQQATASPPEALPAQRPSGPGWTLRDSWVGLALAIPAVILSAVAVEMTFQPRLKTAVALAVYELALLAPVVLVFAWRRVSWKRLGFRWFDPKTLAIGCGLLIATYAATIIHNTILLVLGVPTQADSIVELLQTTASAWGLALGGVLVAPIVEEIVFRGFFFQGLRQSYGSTKAIFISSAVFALMHMQLEALIPTFLLGCALAYVYDRANSIWPGVLLHFLQNLLGICLVLASAQLPQSF